MMVVNHLTLAKLRLVFTFAAVVFILSPLATAQSGTQQGQAQAQTPGSPGQLTPEQIAALRAQQQRQAAAAVARAPFELTQEEEQYRNQVLDYWQQSSDKINKYSCKFRRYEFDTDKVAHRNSQTNQLSAASIGVGELFFASPQRGRYEVNEIWRFAAPPKSDSEQADYKLQDKDLFREKWICDGATIYEFDFQSKRLNETQLPPEMQGAKGLANSPIPFLFGAKREDILNRYWVRVVTPKGTEGEYWLEAFPKKAADAQNYKKIEIVIAEADFLPKAMHMYAAQYDPKKGNFASVQFEFDDRKANTVSLKDFFTRPQKPMGWKRVQVQPLTGNDRNAEAIQQNQNR